MHRLSRTSKPEHQVILLLGLILGVIKPTSFYKMEISLGAGLFKASVGGLQDATAYDERLLREARVEGAVIPTPSTDQTKHLVENSALNTPITLEALKLQVLQQLTDEDVDVMAKKGCFENWSMRSDLIMPTSSFLDKDFGLGEFTSVLNSAPASSGSSKFEWCEGARRILLTASTNA
jgi:hypothetical protein